jgi:hypothetical protein
MRIVRVEDRLNGVDRTRADVAKDNTQRSHDQRRLRRAARAGMAGVGRTVHRGRGGRRAAEPYTDTYGAVRRERTENDGSVQTAILIVDSDGSELQSPPDPDHPVAQRRRNPTASPAPRSPPSEAWLNERGEAEWIGFDRQARLVGAGVRDTSRPHGTTMVWFLVHSASAETRMVEPKKAL